MDKLKVKLFEETLYWEGKFALRTDDDNCGGDFFNMAFAGFEVLYSILQKIGMDSEFCRWINGNPVEDECELESNTEGDLKATMFYRMQYCLSLDNKVKRGTGIRLDRELTDSEKKYWERIANDKESRFLLLSRMEELNCVIVNAGLKKEYQEWKKGGKIHGQK